VQMALRHLAANETNPAGGYGLHRHAR
jgi:hypothetical protein